ncbi:hypothetical protein [Colwellia ponticola]|uniref:Glycosyltransferase n=1 Tax=Colwellia ponticola TaxID=2304625 RepID=A0A8H2PMF4_9GAMM|nr:hypothetical protein [Colwellia ponticola]TMM46387.1 hypothetical protein FCS21_05345 [Colwellia ponticola]
MNAPILITVYDRLESLNKCIKSIIRCPESLSSTLYIASDAPYKPEDTEKVSMIRDYIRSIKGFQKVVLLDSKVNIGSYNNLHSNMKYILNIHDNVIFIEDDNVVNDNFLSFMNGSLAAYKNDGKIKFVCSYLFPDCAPKSKHDIFLWSGFSPWGFATWRESWKEINFDNDSLYEKNHSIKNALKLWFIDPSSLGVLMEDIQGKVKATDVRICYNLILLSGYSVFPKRCVSVNRGHDGNGEHKSNNDIYIKQKLSAINPIIQSNLTVEKRIAIYMFFHRLNLKNIYHLIKFLIIDVKARVLAR